MDFFELVQKRQSVRQYSGQEISTDKMAKILESISLAPSAGNLQAYTVKVVTCPERKNRLAAAAGQQMFLSEAAAVLVFCTDPPQSAQKYRERGETLYAIQDATIACTFAMMSATALGIASVWVGSFDEDLVRECVEGTTESRPVALLPLGYGAETPPKRPRRPMSEMVRYFA